MEHDQPQKGNAGSKSGSEGSKKEPPTIYIFQRGFFEYLQKIFLIPIHRVAVFPSCFLIVVALAERLPIGLIPEELLVSTVRHNVVDNCCAVIDAFR